MKTQIINYKYNRNDIKCGILHIGVGNFHRAHQEYFTNLLLADSTQQNWGICGGMLLPSDERLYKILKEQKNEYTLTVCGRDGKNEVYLIGSLIDLIWVNDKKESIIDKIADPEIKIITLTITEGGYNIEKATGKFNLKSQAVQHDLKDPSHPQSVFGYIAAGLRKRKDLNAPITILSCDNLQHNGNTAKKAFLSFFDAQDKDLFQWVKKNVTFPNSMVDRITPATTPDDIVRLNKENGTHDQATVYCEDFIQWVIEDNFIAGRPAWENVGAELTNDVTAYENMKLSLLNASHTLLSYPSFLSGYRKVDDAMHDDRIKNFVRSFMDKDITRYVPSPGNTDLNLYKKTLLERFSNKTVSDQVARLCADGVSKFPVYIMPNLQKMINDKVDLTRLTYLFAAYRHYLKYQIDDNGNTFEIQEPWLTDNDKKLIKSNNVTDFLSLSAFEAVNLADSSEFVSLFKQMVDAIKNNGAMKTLESIL